MRGPSPSTISLTAALSSVLGLVVTAIWAIAGVGYFWPGWVWLSCFALVAALLSWAHVASRPTGSGRWLLAQAEATAGIAIVLLGVWVLSESHGRWILWPLGSLLLLLAVPTIIYYRHALPFGRTDRLEARVATLTRTRRGALDAQATELRRIERDLHDGAQARLVALSMQLGRAELRLTDNPEAAELVKAAREEASAAIAELRDLARGIAPPVLADRGLVAAVQSLAERSPAPVKVVAEDLGKLPPAVENAAYFVVAESLTNVAKHADGAATQVTLMRHDSRLLIFVTDEGPGGANPKGSGLDGLRARVEALDGGFNVLSPPEGPTVIRAELPCVS